MGFVVNYHWCDGPTHLAFVSILSLNYPPSPKIKNQQQSFQDDAWGDDNNYLLYADPSTGRFTYFNYDEDLTLGGSLLGLPCFPDAKYVEWAVRACGWSPWCPFLLSFRRFFVLLCGGWQWE